MKYCPGCDQEKPLSDFHKKPRYMCMECVREQNRAWHRANATTESYRRKQRDRQLRKNYGLTADDVDRMLDEQGGVCAICQRTPEEAFHPWGFVVDHDHACCPDSVTCGECIRGVICNFCNRTLGLVQDDPLRLEQAIQYLLAWEGMPSRRQQSVQG